MVAVAWDLTVGESSTLVVVPRGLVRLEADFAKWRAREKMGHQLASHWPGLAYPRRPHQKGCRQGKLGKSRDLTLNALHVMDFHRRGHVAEERSPATLRIYEGVFGRGDVWRNFSSSFGKWPELHMESWAVADALLRHGVFRRRFR